MTQKEIMRTLMDMSADTKKLIAFLAALCLFMSAIEYAVPKPLPFLRLGLANVPVLLALEKLRKRDILLLIILKISGQGCIGGTFFSYIFLFSAAGSLASGLTMIFVHRFFTEGFLADYYPISYIGLSIAGALANSAAQLFLAYFCLFGEGTRYIAPLLLISAAITGLLLGIFTERFSCMSRWFQSLPRYSVYAEDLAQ